VHRIFAVNEAIAETEKAIATERKEIVPRIHNEYVAGAGGANIRCREPRGSCKDCGKRRGG